MTTYYTWQVFRDRAEYTGERFGGPVGPPPDLKDKPMWLRLKALWEWFDAEFLSHCILPFPDMPSRGHKVLRYPAHIQRVGLYTGPYIGKPTRYYEWDTETPTNRAERRARAAGHAGVLKPTYWKDGNKTIWRRK